MASAPNPAATHDQEKHEQISRPSTGLISSSGQR
jgi:hypothetical protein